MAENEQVLESDIDNKMVQNNKSEKKQIFLIILCCLAYIFAYTGKYGFAANINLIMSDYGVTKSQAGLVTAFFFFAYGAGQIFNGIFAKKYNKRFIISFSLIASSILNACIFFGIPFNYIKFLWLINGFVQSVLWPTLIEILSQNVNQKRLKTAIVFMSTTTPLGIFLAYGLSALLVALNAYKLIFIISPVLMMLCAIIWIFVFNKCKTCEMDRETNSAEVQQGSQKKSGVIRALLFFIVVMCVFAIFDNLIKDGLTTWVPTILKELYALPDSLSILLTVLLPILGTFGALTAVLLNKKIKSFSMLVVVFYSVSILLLASSLIIIENKSSLILLIVMFGITVLSMHAINNVVTSMVPLYMRDKINSGLLAGILNGFCYVGSTISSYGLAKIVDETSSWSNVFYLLIAGSVICVLLGIVEFIISKVKKKSNNN